MIEGNLLIRKWGAYKRDNVVWEVLSFVESFYNVILAYVINVTFTDLAGVGAFHYCHGFTDVFISLEEVN